MNQNPASGRIRESSIEALRERINLIEVVSQTVSLRKSGSRYMGKCPFHEDSSPSFLVDDKRYHCFGCKAHGDAIAFEIGRTGCTFPEAVETLARRFNFTLEYESTGHESDKDRQLREQRKSIAHIMGEVTRAYSQYLWTSEGRVALQYLLQRGFTENSIRDWEIGLAPQNSVLLRMAEKRGWNKGDLIDAGLLRQRENANEYYDFFRDRIMIPIRDEKGMPVAFGGRVFRDNPNGKSAGPKYLNSPETPLFQKSRTLFNFNRARSAIVQAGQVIVVEGYMDCLAIARAGIHNVVAVLGTALTADHLRKLARVAKQVVLCFDSDNAGREAARKAFETGFPLNLLELQFVSVPSGKDPDDYIREHGPEGFAALISRAVPLASWVCDWYMSQSTTRESQLRRIKNDFVPVVMKNPDPAVREITLEMATVALGLSKISSLTTGTGPVGAGKMSRFSEPQGGPRPQESQRINHVLASGLEMAQDLATERQPCPVSSAEEAALFLSLTHAHFSIFPLRLKNVLRGEQGDEPMDEIVLAQYLSAGMAGPLGHAFLSWSETILQQQEERSLVDLPAAMVPAEKAIIEMRALGSLDPEGLMEAGLEDWVRGVLEPPESQTVAPKLRNLADLKDPVNLPFVRMIVRDVKVSRARSSLSQMLSRTLAQVEISYLDHEIERTNREVRECESGVSPDQDVIEALQFRLRKLAGERVRRHQKFIQRSSP